MSIAAAKNQVDPGLDEGPWSPGAVDPTGPVRPICGDDVIGNMSEAMMRRLVDYMLLPPSKADPLQQVHAMDILLRAVDHSSTQSRRLLSSRIARLRPRDGALAVKLARDPEISVAAPILTEGAMLSDCDLVAIAENDGAERCEIIAARRDVSSTVAAALVGAGHVTAIRVLLENPGARFAPETIDALTALAPDTPELHRALLFRPEMTSRTALDLFWRLNAPLREHVLARFLGRYQVLRTLLEPEEGAPGGAPVDLRFAGDDYKNGLQAMAGNIEKGEIAAAAKKLSEFISIPAILAKKLIQDASGEPLAMALKAAGATSAQFVDCMRRFATSGKAPLSAERDMEGLVSIFERLSRDRARMAITYWHWQCDDKGW